MTDEEAAGASQRLIKQHHAQQKKRYAKAVALIVFAVLAGAVIGVGGTVLYFKNKMHRIPAQPRAIGDAMLERMRAQIALTPEEEARIKPIVDSHLDEVDAMRKESFRNIREVFRRMDKDLESVLGAERMKTWRDFKDKHFGKRRHRDDGRKDERAPDASR